jgi:hypothetical protein
MPRVHVHERRVEAEVHQQRVETARERPAQSARAARDHAVDVEVERRQEVAAGAAGFVVGELGQGLEGHARLVRVDQPVEEGERGRLGFEFEMCEQARGRRSHD